MGERARPPTDPRDNALEVRILLAEDDPRMSALLQRGFTEEGHVVDRAPTGSKALDAALSAEFDVVVLDVMLPDLDGIAVLRQMRERGNRTPVLMLTARDANVDVVLGLNAGADDYLTKPFSFDVLLARLHALARRGPSVQAVRLHVADLTLDPLTHIVTRGGAVLSLTRTEFSLLEYLMRRSGRVVTRQALIEGVWGSGRDVEDNTLDAFVKLLRQKVDRPVHEHLIHTVRGVGYTIRGGP
jgi:DNA-binding response OmpR family regulator